MRKSDECVHGIEKHHCRKCGENAIAEAEAKADMAKEELLFNRAAEEEEFQRIMERGGGYGKGCH